MTVENQVNKTEPQVMGTTVDYPFTFTVLTKDPTEDIARQAIKVIVSDGITQTQLTYGTDYSVTLNKNGIGGTVTVTDKRTSDYSLIVYREYDFKQESDYQNYNAFPADTMEQNLDKLTMIAQQLKEKSDRAVTVDMFSEADPSELVNEIEALYGVKDEVITAAGNIDSIVTAAENIDAIVDAPDNATSAAQSATSAAQSEANALSYEQSANDAAQRAANSSISAIGSANQAMLWAIGAISTRPEGSAKYWAEYAAFGNIGDIKYTTRTDVPNGGVWCDGTEYTKEQFPDVYKMLVDGKISYTDYETFDGSVTTNGSCSLFALDTDTTSFKVPKLENVYLKAGQSPSIFSTESLPNVRGSTGISVPNNTSVSGAFKKGASKTVASLGSQTNTTVLDFDASDLSSTYQDGAKVNPDHVVYRAYVILYSSAAEASEAQAAEFITGLSNKANIDLGNVVSNIDYVVEKAVYEEGRSGYFKLRSGILIQWGISYCDNTSGFKTITFLKPFKNIPTVIGTIAGSSFTQPISAQHTQGAQTVERTYFTAYTDINVPYKSWVAIGRSIGNV